MHTLRQRSGQALMAALGQAAADSGALVLTRTLARELRHDGQGRITAVICERPDGTRESIGCDALILACNGFGGNAAMVREHLPAMADAVYGGHAGNDGSAVRWGRELGAGLADMGAYQGHGSWATPQGALVSWAVIMDGGVQVNRLGLRFHDETQGYSEAAVRVLAQPDGVAWNVFDDQALALVRDFPDFQAARAAGALRTADDVPALAALIGCDARALADTLRSVARVRRTSMGDVSRAPCPRRITRSRSLARCSIPRAGWTLTRVAACGGRTAACFRTCWRRVLRAACRATTWRAICRATACSAPSRAAISPPRRPPGSRAWRWPMSRLRSGARPQACA